MTEIKIARPGDPIGGVLFNLIFGEEDVGTIVIPDALSPDKANEMKENLTGLFTVSSKLTEMIELWEESNKLMTSINNRLEILEEKLKL